MTQKMPVQGIGNAEREVISAPRTIHMIPLDNIGGYEVRPGFYEINGATAIPCGVNFTVHSVHATACELLLFHRTENEPYAVLRFPDHYRIGYVYSMIVFGLNIEEFEYAYRVYGPYAPERGMIFNSEKYLLDPYAKAVTGQSEWGKKPRAGGGYRARVVRDDFDWGNSWQPLIPMEDLIIYEAHVRGFTQHASSGTDCPGTFRGLMEKLPYLKELGVNAIELLPVFEFDEMREIREYNGKQLLDYWGYNSVSFFAPNTGYTFDKMEYNREGHELKWLIRKLHENGMEVILDVVFNHTAEGGEDGPFFSFKGFDNNIYYMLMPNGGYYNFSGCGNTLNCNHPIVQQMIIECLRYWVVNYRVDGFRFDLASILGRNEDGSPMNKPPLLQSLAYDPILGNIKLIAEAWDAGGMYQVGSFPSWDKRWAEWNGRYRDDLRSFLKGDGGFAEIAANRIAGSQDLYDPGFRGSNASVNFITCHDGFTLYDLYSYGRKHNEENGWKNTDGSDDNRSWNCGIEGDTDNQDILALRRQLVKNACAVLMCSRGTPMFLAGDEFCNSQLGNNNAYCQDNEISWLDWGLLEKNSGVYEFFRYMTAFRKAHEVIRRSTAPCSLGFPDISFHGARAWDFDKSYENRTVGVMFAGQSGGVDDIVYLAVNAHWEEKVIQLPQLPPEVSWRLMVNTGATDNCIPAGGGPLMEVRGNFWIALRSVAVLVAGSRNG